MKWFFRILLGILFLIIIGAFGGYFYFKDKFFTASENHLQAELSDQVFDMRWRAVQLDDRVDPHGSLFFPVQLDGIQRTFYMQFDLGAPSSMLYSKAIFSLQDSIGDLPIDSLEGKAYTRDFKFNIADNRIQLKKTRILNYGRAVESPEINDFPIIGTIGSDLLDGRYITLNFKESQCILSDSLPLAYSDVKMNPFDFRGRRILLPGKMNDEERTFMYDSGSSTFELISNPKDFKRLAKASATPDTFQINSWGKSITGYQVEADFALGFGESKLKAERITYLEWPNKSQALLMRFSGMGGMIGNKIFMNHTLILDGKHAKFAVIPSR